MDGSVTRRARRAGAILLAAALAAGCATEETKRSAVEDINREFRADYERVLREKGTRVPPVPVERAYAAMRVALARLETQTVNESPAVGYLSVQAPAPRPLSNEEWQRAAATDQPRLCEIVRRHIPLVPCASIVFEPEIFDILITATVREVAAGAEVSLTMRMREKKPPPSGFPAREYPPPTAVRMGLDKIWAEFERELRAQRR